MFDHIVVTVAEDNAKSCLFTVEERVGLLKHIFKNEPRLKIDTFSGLLVEYAKKKNVKTLLRGIRSVADYEYELQMSLANRMLNQDVDTLFMMTEGRYSHISSSIVKQIAALGGSLTDLVHPVVEKKLKEKFSKRS